jgi:hypothetical protein
MEHRNNVATGSIGIGARHLPSSEDAIERLIRAAKHTERKTDEIQRERASETGEETAARRRELA